MAKQIDEYGCFVGQTGIDRFFERLVRHSVTEVKAFLAYFNLEPEDINVNREWIWPTGKNRRGKRVKPSMPLWYRLPRGRRFAEWRWPRPPTRHVRVWQLELDEQVRRRQQVEWRRSAARRDKLEERRRKLAPRGVWSRCGKLILTPRTK